jgi:hypothetical protein
MQLPTVTSRTSQTDTGTKRGLSALFKGRAFKVRPKFLEYYARSLCLLPLLRLMT